MAQQSQSFTTVSRGGLLNVLKNQCGIAAAFEPTAPPPTPSFSQFDAIWDTGATNSCITQTVVDALGLVASGIAEVHGVHGSSLEETFLVNILLPNHVGFAGVQVTKAKLLGAEILIGMDVINQGDFAVTNKDGKTRFSFRIPSMREIDFVQEHNTKQAKHGGTNKGRKKGPKGPGGKKRRK